MLLQAEALQASFNPKAHAGLLGGMGLQSCQQASPLASLLPVWHQQRQQGSDSTSPSPSALRSNGEIAGLYGFS